jgi:hypothetical protein
MNVFLSYSSSDREFGERLAYGLRDEGDSVFFDRTSLPPGEGYHARIRSAIEECQLFIFLVSYDAVSSGSYALTELGIAQQKWANPSGRILPVTTSDIDPDLLPPYLNAVTVLRPKGDLVAEVVAAVSQLRFRHAESVKIISSLTNSGWMWTFDILMHEPVKEIFYRFAEEDTFTSTGFTRVRDRRTGLVQPRSDVEVPLFTGTRTFFVKYITSSESEHGPYPLVVNAVQYIAAETKAVLELTRNAWVAFREYPEGRMLLYFTHLVSYKNGLKEIQYSIDNQSLSQHVRFTPDWSGPGAPGIAEDDETCIEIPMSSIYVEIKLVFIDGSEWPARRFPVSVSR